MATVIDSLIIELGLDPKKLTQGQRAAIDSFRKTREDATREGKGVEDAARRVVGGLSEMRSQLLGLFALFMGGRGIKEMVSYLTQADSSVGRLAYRTEASVEAISKWQGAARMFGGDARSMANSIGGLVQEFQTFALTGDSNLLPTFRSLGVVIAEADFKMRKFEEIFLDLSAEFKKRGPAEAFAYGTRLGLDEGTINLLLKGPEVVAKYLAAAQRTGPATKEAADAAQALATAWSRVEQASEGISRLLLTMSSSTIVKVLDRFSNLMERWMGTSQSSGEASGKNLRLRFGTPDEVDESLRSIFGGKGGVFGPLSRALSGESRPAASLRTKPGAGEAGAAISALAHALQGSIPGLDKFTSFNDPYHALLGRGSGHTKGLALDFTLKDPSQSAQVAAQIRAKLAELGINATVLDEYKNPSPGSTGGHLHVGFANAAAARAYYDLATGAGSVDNRRSSTSSSEVNINGPIQVYTQATDAAGIAGAIGDSLKRWGVTTQNQYGPS